MLTTLLTLVLAFQAQPATTGRVRETAYARIDVAQRIAADSELVQAVLARNKMASTPAQIRRLDEQWIRNPDLPLRKELTQNPCATRLRKLIQEDGIVIEALLMDAQGALVCSTIETSDYWQGDEDKWLKTYKTGRIFVDEPALDANTHTYAVQLSVPVLENGKPIGALTLTLRVPGGTAARQ